MNERLLQYIWQFQHFNLDELRSVQGDLIVVLEQGKINYNQGPDFLNARIRINETVWFGNVELHTRTSEWFRHAHDLDPQYLNVILHVVFTNDLPEDSLTLPTLVLEHRIKSVLVSRYGSWMHKQTKLPCGNQMAFVDDLVWTSWKERLVIERLNEKSKTLQDWLGQTSGHWDEVLWRVICRSFGSPVNTEAFAAVAVSVPLKILARHRQQLLQLECLLLGQAGLLNSNFRDDYAMALKKEYEFLSSKYQLRPVDTPVNFLRMRPPAFPTVRFAILASLLHKSRIPQVSTLLKLRLSEAKGLLDATAGDYWDTRYVFDEAAPSSRKKTGMHLVHQVVVNALVPFLYFYGEQHSNDELIMRAVEWLRSLPPEVNAITRIFGGVNVQSTTASDSQALLQLNSRYCDEKRCLDCAAGHAILKRGD